MKEIVISIILIIICILGLIYTNKDSESAIKHCVEQGNSKEMCERQFYGIY